MLFQSIAARELRAVVERDRVATFLVQFLETLFESLMHVVGMLGAHFEYDRVPRLAVDQRGQTARARRAEHRVAFEVAESRTLFDDFRTIGDPRAPGGFRRFSAVGPLAAPPQERLPMLAVFVLFDPGVDGLGRDAKPRLVGSLLLQTAGDLLGRPLLRQTVADEGIDLRIVRLARQRTFSAPALGRSLGLGRVIRLARAVAFQLAADGRWGAFEGGGDFLLIGAADSQLSFPISFF